MSALPTGTNRILHRRYYGFHAENLECYGIVHRRNEHPDTDTVVLEEKGFFSLSFKPLTLNSTYPLTVLGAVKVGLSLTGGNDIETLRF